MAAAPQAMAIAEQRTFGLWTGWLTLLLVGTLAASVIFYDSYKSRLAAAGDQATTQIDYLKHVVSGALRAGEYQQLRDHIRLWGELDPDTLSLTLTADSGFELGRFQRDRAAKRSIVREAEISFSYRGVATLRLEKSLEPALAAATELGWQMAAIVVMLALAGLLVMMQMYRYREQVGITQAEFERRVAAQAALERMATHDPLTGLPNRRMLDDLLRQRIAEAERFGRRMALLFVDLDDFKTVNDSFGHAAGDQLLGAVGERIKRSLRGYDLLARFGGDEFVVLLTDVKVVEEAEHVAQKIVEALEQRIIVGDHELFASCSIGISLYPDDGASEGDLLRTADAAMYTAKNAGKNCYRFFTTAVNDDVDRRQKLEQGLRRGLENGELYLVYQPQLDLASGRIVSCEALLRWRSGDVEIPPGEFIPLAEKSVLMRQVQRFVITSAVSQRAQWKRLGIDNVRIDINISGGRLLVGETVSQLLDTLVAHDLAPTDVGIELTEHTLIEATADTIAGLNALRQLGCCISLDDFGTGYSSLGYLKQLPIDVLKIDRTFVKDLPHGQMDSAIVRAVIAMGRSMNKRTLAEGVETQAQLEFVKAHGCDLAQGFLLHRPMPADEVETLLQSAGGRLAGAS